MDEPLAPDASAGSAITFLFTDIEGSTGLWELAPATMCDALAAHDALAREVVAAAGGRVVKMAGDGMHAAFDDPSAALACALAFQQGLRRIAVAHALPLRARCGLHRGRCESRDGDYFGTTVNRAARVMAAASGGQVLLSAAVAEVARLPADARWIDRGAVRLRDLAHPEMIVELAHADLTGVHAPLRSLDAAPNNLVSQLTSFLGREEELRQLHRLLRDGRLVTVTGPGGIGKTRLALHAAAELVHRHVDGVWVVDLSSVTDGARVPAVVAEVLRVRDADADPVGATGEYLAPRATLVVLDTCEHVLPACAALVARLLGVAPRLTVLATSRESLGVPGERVVTIAPLAVPVTFSDAETSPAMRLFIERARDQRPDFATSPLDLEKVAEIVRRLEGIPLAIELAAARVVALTAGEIAARLSDRFRLLSRGLRSTLPRQRTLDALVAWSYDLLADDEQRVFAALGVFSGGFEIQGAQAVCGDDDVDATRVADVIESLVAKSLVVALPRAGAMRYRMLDTLREFAQLRLAARGEAQTRRDRHAAWCSELAGAAEAAMRGPRQAEWIDRLDAEHANLRAALDWWIDGGSLDALVLAARLWRYWHMRGRLGEGRAYLDRALALQGATGSNARADALYAAGALAKNQSDYARAVPRLEEAAAAFRVQGRTRDLAAALGSLGNVRHDTGKLAEARTLHEEARALFRAAGDDAAEATALLNLGSVALDQGDLDDSVALHEQAIAHARRLGLGAVECMSEVNLGQLALDRRDTAAARRHLDAAVALGRRIRFRVAEAMALAGLAAIAVAEGDLPGARRDAGAALRMLDDAGATAPLLDTLDIAAEALAVSGSMELAARVLSSCDGTRRDLGLPMLARSRRVRERLVAGHGLAGGPRVPGPAPIFPSLKGAVAAVLDALEPSAGA